MSTPGFGRALATLGLGRAVFRKQLILMFRYPVNLLSGLLTLYLFFAMVFFGGQAVAGEALADNLEGIIIGFLLWSMSLSAYSDLTRNVMREAQWGTLEQLYMSVYRFELVMLLKSIVNILLSFLTGAVILVLMMLTTQQMLVIDLVTIVPVIVLGLLSVVGIGFIFGGLAVIYKRVENAFQIVTFGLVALVGAPVGSVPALGALPLSQSSYLLRQSMEDGVRLWEFPAADLGVLVAVAFAYLAGGVLFFRVAQRRARKLGVLGHY